MPGPTPKTQSTRARRNKASTRTTLVAVHPDDVVIPDLPSSKPVWQPRTLQHWEEVMSSPMAPEYDESDLQALFMVAELWDDFYLIEAEDLPFDRKARLRSNLMGEIRLQEQRFGLTPIDRRRLQWEIDRGEEADEKTRERRNKRTAQAAPKEGEPDPRQILS